MIANDAIMSWLCQVCGRLIFYIRISCIVRLVICILLLLFYCEFLHYYVILIQCTWPRLEHDTVMDSVVRPDNKQIKIMLLGDTHLLGFRDGHWFDKLRREWQMERTFQTSMFIHNPDVVFILGDLLDEGQWCPDDEFKYHVERFQRMFRHPAHTDVQVLVGNHDIGFHYMVTDQKDKRFKKAFDAPSVKLLHIKNISFVLLNSMAMEGDGCGFCREAEAKLRSIATSLNCSRISYDEVTMQNDFSPYRTRWSPWGTPLDFWLKYFDFNKSFGKSAHNKHCVEKDIFTYTRPILLQHFPMYRKSDSNCSLPDAAPPEIINDRFKERFDCLSRQASKQLFSSLNPRLVISAHTHHGCYRVHKDGVPEWTVSSFSWRNKNNPAFLLMTLSNTHHAVHQCLMPEENTQINTYLVGALMTFIIILLPKKFMARVNDKHR